ncbi:hypothetical protein EDB92DRAFT_1951144 [Lactarius akahatsu]|uniref:Uncharacterized protein n=1 Tax=Lactarius akahatsu TaxID=416441 RepID=A0AAD4L9U1_9AGAM|nr:hypothetical protein EDB92DRAFT_1951144 [Lactarius akahatsu]
MDETLHHMAHVDNPVDDPISKLSTEGATTGTIPPPTAKATVVCKSFQPPADKLVHLETDVNGRPILMATMPISWAGIVTQKVAHQQTTTAANAREVNQSMGHTPGGKLCPETAARWKDNPNTEVMIVAV